MRYDAVGQPGIGNWTVDLEVNSNATSTETDGRGVYDWLRTSQIKSSWDNKANYDIYSDLTKNKYYTGSSIPTHDETKNDYSSLAEPAVDYARGSLVSKIPYGDEVMTVGETIKNLVEEFAGASKSGGSRKTIKKNFDWPRITHDTSYWVKFEVKGPPKGDLLVDVKNRTNRVTHPAFTMETNTQVYISFPNLSPSAYENMSESELYLRNVSRADAATVRNNPRQWGISASVANSLEDGTVYIHHADPSTNGRIRQEMMHNLSD